MSVVVVTMDALPGPPITAHKRVGIELLRALSESFAVEAVVYASPDEIESLKAFWGQRPVRFHSLRRRNGLRHCRSMLRRLSLPTVTRDFAGEAALVRRIAVRDPATRLVINFISGAPLLGAVCGSGVVLSGHDCMSSLFSQEGLYSRGIRDRATFLLRRWFAQNAERRYSHLAEAVHVVSQRDAEEWKRVNPAARPRVIPLGNDEPDPGKLLPWPQRRQQVVWGNLASSPVVKGLREILGAAEPRTFDGWMLLGRVSRQRAEATVPELGRHAMEYHEHVSDMTGILAATRLLLLPDIGGTGQKTRTQDGLSHGCCVIGLPEAFRGLECEEGIAPYICAPDPRSLVRRLAGLTEAEAERCGSGAREFFGSRCSRPVLARRWHDFLGSLGTLDAR